MPHSIKELAEIFGSDSTRTARCGCGHFTAASEQLGSLSAGAVGDNPFNGPRAVEHYAPNQWVMPLETKINISKISFAERRVQMKVVHLVRMHADAAGHRDRQVLVLNGVGFRNLQVSCFHASSTNNNTENSVAIDFGYDNYKVTIRWPDVDSKADQLLYNVQLEYEVKDPIAGLYFSYPDADYPDMPVYVVTDHETECARYWLACIDYPSVRAKLKFEIEAPESMVALANGSLVSSEKSGDGLKVVKYKLSDNVCPSYLICWAVGEFTEVRDRDGEIIASGTSKKSTIPISYFAPKMYAPEDIKRAFDQTPDMISWLQRKLDSPFPWPKYYQIAVAEVGGAMENISLVTWNDRFIMDPVWASERKLIMDLVNIHEMAHTYFGDLITCRHFEHVWLKESWATYMESVWLEDHHGEDHFRYELLMNSEQYFGECDWYMRPMVQRTYASSWSLFDNHTYPGGACRIHMLRKLMGEKCFWGAVQKYVAKHRGTVVETDDFRKVMEGETGMNLTRFFDEWYYMRGYPVMKVSHSCDSDSATNKFTFEQTQVDKQQNIPLFHVAVDVEVTATDGSIHRATIDFENNVRKQFASVQLPKGTKPKIIRIDPDGKILAKFDFEPSEAILLETCKSAKDVVNRIRAYTSLIKIGTPSVMQSVFDAIGNEPFYGVRVHVAEALTSNKTRFAVDALAQMVVGEKDPMAQWQLIKMCRIRDDKIRAALKTVLKQFDKLAYKAREFALDNLGYQLNEDDLDFLFSVAQDPKQLGQHNFVRAGALRSLAHFAALPNDASTRVYNFLYEHVSVRKSEPFRLARPTAVSALTKATLFHPTTNKSLKLKTMGLLAGLALRDPDFAVRKSALVSLVELDAKETASDLLASRPLYPAQDWEWVDRQIGKLTSSKLTTGAEYQKKIEALETRLRQLEDKVLSKDSEKANDSDKPKCDKSCLSKRFRSMRLFGRPSTSAGKSTATAKSSSDTDKSKRI